MRKAQAASKLPLESPAKAGLFILQFTRWAMEKRKFGNKLVLPSVVQIKHQILLRWIDDQQKIEMAEAKIARDQNY